MYKNSEEYKNKVSESIKINKEYKQIFGSFDIEMGNIGDDPKRIKFILKNMLANPLYINWEKNYINTLICVLDRMFEHTSISIEDNTEVNSGTYIKWETSWDFSILYEKDDSISYCRWTIKYGNLPYWGTSGYASISPRRIPFVIQKMKENPKILAKSASVIVLEKELNMTAKLHNIFGCWYLRSNNKDCLVNYMVNNPFNIWGLGRTNSEWTFDVDYKGDIIAGQTISDIFKYVLDKER